MDDRQLEDFILFYGWWTKEIKFNKENNNSYVQDFPADSSITAQT